MKKTSLTLLLSISCCWLAAQCPTADITFSTQGQVDSFPINYPGCSEMDSSLFLTGSAILRLDSLYALKKIGGRLEISNTGLTNMAGLNQLDSVKSAMTIANNPSLLSLAGLGNLQFVGRFGESFGIDNYAESGLTISNNLELNVLQGLQNLKMIEGCLNIFSNPSLVSIADLSSLSSIGKCEYFGGAGSTYGSIHISSNSSLFTLTGLNGIYSVEADVSISDNSSLKSLTGLDNIQQIGGGLFINSNDSLTALGGLEKLDSLGGCLVIEYNNSLATLDAIERLKWIGVWFSGHPASLKKLNIIGNPQLSSLSGLDSIEIPLGGRIWIFDCPLLATCGVYSICQYFQNGGLAIISKNAPGCNSVAEIEAGCIVSIEDAPGNELDVRFSPNPASSFLNIQLNEPGTWEVGLFDFQGHQVLHQSLPAGQRLDVQHLAVGFYALKVAAGERVFVGKFVKQ
ncbi:MAG: T9SS type A sorting domain-containing protein [Saprospiraceae bacterium]|jgi:hypothetical protein|nr:T9SS type A sorting domain-containing protein [Saprospiraceae bacterium]